MDPDRGNPKDAFLASCRFSADMSETCVKPQVTRLQEQKWVTGTEEHFRWVFNEIDMTKERIEYRATPTQLLFLRLEHSNVRQNMTYNCKNAHAHKDASGQERMFMKFLSDDEMEMSTEDSMEVMSDGCSVKDGKWHETVFNVDTNDLERLPISNVAVKDVADGEEEFGLKIGAVCFY